MEGRQPGATRRGVRVSGETLAASAMRAIRCAVADLWSTAFAGVVMFALAVSILAAIGWAP